MAFADYTTPKEVRSILGISEDEIEDEAIDTNARLTGMIEAMYRLNPSLPQDYLTTKNTPARSAAQNRFVMLAGTFCAYTAALELIPSLALAAPKEISDGKSVVSRVDNPFSKLEPTLAAARSYFKDSLFEAYKLVFPNVVLAEKQARINIISTGLGSDPVTGV